MPFRELVWLFGGRIIAAFVALLSFRLATELLTPFEFGTFAILTAIQTFCGLLLVNPVGQHINRLTHAWMDEGVVLSRLKPFGWYLVGVGAVGGVLGGFSVDQPGRAMAALGLILVVIGASWNATAIPLLNMLGARMPAVTWTVLTAVVGLTTSLLLARISPTAGMWILGQALGLLTGAAIAMADLRRRLPTIASAGPPPPLFTRSLFLTFLLPLAAATGLMWFQLNGYRFIVRDLWGLESLGQVAAGFVLAAQLWSVLEGSAQQIMLPLFYRRSSGAPPEVRADALGDLLNVLGPVYLVVIAAAIAASDALMIVLSSPLYVGAGVFLAGGAIMEGARAIGNLLNNGAQIADRMSMLWLPYALGGSINVVLLVAVHAASGPLWLVAALLPVGAVITLGFIWRQMQKVLPAKLDLVRWVMGLVALFVGWAALHLLRKPEDLTDALATIVAISLASATALAVLLARNSALQRLMSTQLPLEALQHQTDEAGTDHKTTGEVR
jgi:O-antigen/teichoic acid export membrane protein